MFVIFKLLRCSRLGLVALAYLWRRDQGELLQEMIDNNIDAIIIKVAALGLDPTKHLGLRISEIQPHLIKMVSVCIINPKILNFMSLIYFEIYVSKKYVIEVIFSILDFT
jgi:diphthine-ammonia ligase